MRIAEAALLLFLLGGCSSGASSAASDGLIDCAIGDAAAFVHGCAVDRSQVGGEELLVVRHPDGGFRRFDVVDGGHAIEVADGVEPARSVRTAGGIAVSVAQDRYRFPTAMLGDATGK